MFNIKELWKATNTLTTYFGTPEEAARQQADSNGIERLSAIQVCYRELRLLGGFQMLNHMRQTSESRDILWGRRFNDPDYVQNVTLKKISDVEWLQSLPPNTLGAHIGHLFKNFTIDELYEKRYTEEEQQREALAEVIGVTGNAYEEMRVNMSRLFFLTHDIYHAIFRYDTSSMGESCIQGVTKHMVNFWPMQYVGLAIATRMVKRLKTLEPYRVYFEAERIGKKAADAGLFMVDPAKLLEMDIQEIRDKYNVEVPVRYKAFTEKYSNEVKLDNLHPKYEDIDWDTAEVTI